MQCQTLNCYGVKAEKVASKRLHNFNNVKIEKKFIFKLKHSVYFYKTNSRQIITAATCFFQVNLLDLSNNDFTSIPKDISQYQHLQKLIFAHNRINSLGSTVFKDLHSLESLDLSWNTIRRSRDLHPNALKNLTQLKQLDLSSNTLKTFPECTSATLEHLTLENCSIYGLNPGILNYFPALKTLNFAQNSISVLQDQFRSKTLQVFNLTQCQIKTVDSTALNNFKSLQELYLTRNYQLKSFNANSTTLIHLDLKDCNLESVPHSWLPNLTTLQLSGNHIRRIEADWLQNMPRLQRIILSDNSIDFIEPDRFTQAMYLVTLDLSRNTFRNLDEKIFKNSLNLKLVNMSRTYIDEMIPFQSKSLLILDLTNCEIRQIKWDSLKGMSKLQILYLSGNQIKEIPLNITSTSLLKLDLSNNRLSTLKNTTFFKVPNLQSLNLIGNRLVHLEFYSSFRGIRTFFVGDNPWRCECENRGFENMFKYLNEINSDVEGARCQTPQNLEGKTWNEACSSTWFPWNFAQSDKAWMVSVTILAVFILSCCLFVSINRECNKRKKRQREADAERRSEVQERLMAMMHASRDHFNEESHNAPDPRAVQGPPSYNEAITLPPLGSTASLYSRKEEAPSIHGSTNTINLNQSRSTTNLNNNNPETKEKRVRRKKRPKSPHRLNRMSQASQESRDISDANQSSSQQSYVRSSSHMSERSQSNPDLLDKSGRPLSAKTRRRRQRSRTRSQTLGESSSDDTSVFETKM